MNKNHHPLYSKWKQIRQRCNNPNHTAYRFYGGRGITIDQRWNDFYQFVMDMGKRPSPFHSVDRIDTNGPYSPENCRWATARQQANNVRSNRRIQIGSHNMTVTEWTRAMGYPLNLIFNRLDKGWSPEAAIYYPPTGRRRDHCSKLAKSIAKHYLAENDDKTADSALSS